MDHILVPLDTSEVSARALDTVVRFAGAFDARVTLLTVLDTAVRNGLEAAASSENTRVETEAETYLGAMEAQLSAAGVKTSTLVLDAIDAAAAITDTAVSLNADLVVMCTHGRTGAERWLLGSVTDRVIRSSEVPVHVIPVRAARNAEPT